MSEQPDNIQPVPVAEGETPSVAEDAPPTAEAGAPTVDDSDIRAKLSETSGVKFKLDVFEGPLDLLLYLIKINELDINMVALHEITGQYLDYIRMMETLDLELAGDYLVVAATLINIKLRAILPSPEEEEEQEEETLDDLLSARQLMQQLIEYRNFKEAAYRLGERAEAAARVFFREIALPKITQVESDPQLQGDLDQLIKAFQRVVSFVERKGYHAVENEEYYVEDKILMLRQRMFTEERLDLIELFKACRAKLEMIVTLMGVLELCKLREVRILQGESEGVLYVAHRKDAPPPETGENTEEETQEEPEGDGAPVIAIASEDNGDGKDEEDEEPNEKE